MIPSLFQDVYIGASTFGCHTAYTPRRWSSYLQEISPRETSVQLFIDDWDLCCTLEVDEDKLCLDVKNILQEVHTEVAAVVDQWLLEMSTSWPQYLTKVVNCKSSVDGLFA